eukprot:Colp12_sorted_trinity150504_noHs@2414
MYETAGENRPVGVLLRTHLVAVVLGLVGALGLDAEVGGLVVVEHGELDVELGKVETGDLLVKTLGKHVHVNLVVGVVLPQLNLGKDLVGERVGHDEGGMASGAAKVDETALGEEDDVAAVLEGVAVNLGLDVDTLSGVGVKPRHIDLAVEVTDVAEDGVLLHLLEVVGADDALATSGGDEDVGLLDSLVEGGDLVTLHGSLESVNGVDLGNDNTGTEAAEGSSATLADITVTSNEGDLTSDHDIGGTLDTIKERLTATVEVVELALGDGVVDVDGGALELTLLHHLVQVVHTSGGLLGDTLDTGKELGVLVVDDVGEVTTVVKDHVEGLAIGEEDGLLNAPVVLLIGLTLPGIDRDASGGNGGGSVILGGEDVAGRPLNLSTEGGEGLNENGSLDGHVETTSNAGTLEGLLRAVETAHLHETGHLILSELDLLATPLGKGDVSDFVSELSGHF